MTNTINQETLEAPLETGTPVLETQKQISITFMPNGSIDYSITDGITLWEILGAFEIIKQTLLNNQNAVSGMIINYLANIKNDVDVLAGQLADMTSRSENAAPEDSKIVQALEDVLSRIRR